MATYYVWSGATGTNAGTSWTNAYTAFGSAVTAATASGDVILVHYTHQEELAADTTYTFGNHVNVVSVDKDSSDAPTVMGTGGWIGNSTTNRFVALNGAYKVYFYGVTFRTAGSTADELRIDGSDGSNFEFESVYFWNGNTSTSSYIRMGLDASNQYLRFTNCTFRFGSTSQNIAVRGARVEFDGCTIASAGSAPAILFDDVFGANNTAGSSPDIVLTGCDLSHVTGTLVGSMNMQARTFKFAQCKLGANVTILATQTPANKSSGVAWVFDCASGDSHGLFGYYDAFGSCVSGTTIYLGVANQSWLITSSSNASRSTPFVSPWIDLYNTTTSQVAPFLEILSYALKPTSATQYTDAEVWIEIAAKTTSGSTQSILYTDRATPLATGSTHAAGTGSSNWTGTAALDSLLNFWSGKLVAPSLTPAETGHIRARVCVAASITNFLIDPQIRT